MACRKDANDATLGYGDAMPIGNSRLVGLVLALNGLLLIGWSVAIIFEVIRTAELRIGRNNVRTG